MQINLKKSKSPHIICRLLNTTFRYRTRLFIFSTDHQCQTNRFWNQNKKRNVVIKTIKEVE